MIIRKLLKKDLNDKYFFQTLSNLREVGKMSLFMAQDILLKCESQGIEIYVADKNGLIVGTVRLLSEPKFYHQGRCAGHIEDVATHKDYLGQGVARGLIEHVINVCQERSYYKIILDCSEDLINFYEKFGFKISENNMRLNL